MKAILAKKLEMTHIFDEKGNFVPGTLLMADGNVVTQVKTEECDGYSALQIGFGAAKKLNKPESGHLKKVGKPLKYLAEMEMIEGETQNVGDIISVDMFSEGDIVDVRGLSKGKGFAGTVKRHNFNTGPKTHGSHNYRAPGSIGAGYPQHVMKGQKLPGRMGGGNVTEKNLKIAKVFRKEGLILVRGAVPGPKKGVLLITLVKKAKKAEENIKVEE
jgi:large subunit ribosomal protein L3